MNETLHSSKRREREFKTDMGAMVYITAYRLENIMGVIPVQTLESLCGRLYKRSIFMFSDRERQRLMAVKSFFEDSDAFIRRYWKPATSGDSSQLVFADAAPVYHLNPECEMLHSDYKNVEIPAQIMTRGEEDVRGFRKWAHQNKSVFIENPERFKLMICTEFNIPVAELNLIMLENSGATSVINENCNAISIQIDRVLREAENFYHESAKNSAILGQYQKYTYLGFCEVPLRINRTGYSEDTVRELLRYYHSTFKKPLKRLLISYFSIRYNHELSFNGYLHEQLGLRCCEKCRSRKAANITKADPAVKAGSRPAAGETPCEPRISVSKITPSAVSRIRHITVTEQLKKFAAAQAEKTAPEPDDAKQFETDDIFYI